MAKTIDIEPSKNEMPTDFADRIGVYYTSMVSKDHKKQNGQFFTPSPIAKFMGNLVDIKKTNLKILDPGCGTAILTCGLIEKLTSEDNDIEEIELTAYETDQEIKLCTIAVLTYLTKWLNEKSIKFSYQLILDDFILKNASVFLEESVLGLFQQQPLDKFDIIISNPPYFKLSKDDIRAKVSGKVNSGQPNIYALFMAVASKLLSMEGQLLFITPRSFASGNYFSAFRRFFLKNIQLQQIHLFVSRRETFNRDEVLQEAVILKGVNKLQKGSTRTIVSSSNGISDLHQPNVREFEESELIDFSSKEKILHLPTSDNEEQIIKLFKSWRNTLKDFGIKISTGPVVAFRATEFIRETYNNGTVFLAPLYWLNNVSKMKIEWPVHKAGKGQYIKICQPSQSLLIPNRNYVFLRRFSAKDDKSRLVAAPYFTNPCEPDFIGVENKVNYICRNKGVLERNEAIGLAALLNSKLFDT